VIELATDIAFGLLGIAMSLAILGFALVGDALRDILDPTRRR